MQKVEIAKTALAPKKRILLIDNQSVHLASLQGILSEKMGADFVEVRMVGTREVHDSDVAWSDVVVLSGGTGRSIEKNPETFRRLVGGILAQSKPMVGICLGAEAIAYYYGAQLHDIGVRRVGNIPVTIDSGLADEMGLSSNRLMVYEFHRWSMKTVPAPLCELGQSKDGIEIFRHTTLPVWGLQFHPEVRRLDNDGHLVLEYIFQTFFGTKA